MDHDIEAVWWAGTWLSWEPNSMGVDSLPMAVRRLAGCEPNGYMSSCRTGQSIHPSLRRPGRLKSFRTMLVSIIRDCFP